jgi:hypothetical protein
LASVPIVRLHLFHVNLLQADGTMAKHKYRTSRRANSAFKLLMIGNDSLRVLMEKVVNRPF